MASTVFGSFSDADQARGALGDLLSTGIRPDQVSLVIGSAGTAAPRNAPPKFQTDVPLGHSVPITFSGTNGTGNRLDPFDNSMHEVASRIEGDAENNANLDSVLNPSQDDYPRTGSASPTELSSAPPDAERDYNAGLETNDYAKDYSADAARQIARDEHADRERANAPGVDSDSGTTPEDSPEALRARMEVRAPRSDAVQNAPLVFAEDRSDIDGTAPSSSETLITTDIPGVGAVAGGGPLAMALTGPGSLETQLAAAGMPQDRAGAYAQQLAAGGAMVAVSLDNGTTPADALETLRRHGATRAEATTPVGS